MAYQVPASKKSEKQNRFEFQVTDKGTVYSLPLAKYLPPRTTLELADASNGAQVLRRIFDEYAPGSLDELEDSEQFNALVEAWQADSGISVGESGASSGS